MAEKIRDLKQVGVSKKASEQIKELVENYEYFHNEQDVYRLAVAIAVAAGDKHSESIMKSDMPTKWRVEDDAGDSTGDGQRLEDKDGNLKAFMTAMVPEAKSAPYRYSQYYATLGINRLHKALFEDKLTLYEALAKYANTKDD